jgi:hypothetical protein
MIAERQSRPYYLPPWGMVLTGNIIGECAFALAAIVGGLSHAWLPMVICGTLAIVHACYIAFLLNLGRRGWNRRWTQG